MGSFRIHFIKFVVFGIPKLEILRRGYDNYIVTIIIIVLFTGGIYYYYYYYVSRIFTRKPVL